jgi:3'-phosphoadenosine 5'-phosphosulfate sulfotransferase (PAPS reductase)/FAD synthetase
VDENKIKESLRRIRSNVATYGESIFLGHSGGKDSCVIMHLAKQVAPNMLVVHNPKPSSSIATIQFLYQMAVGRQITFVPIMDMERFTLRHRLTMQIDGSRMAEAYRTDGRSNNIIENGKEISRDIMKVTAWRGLFGLTFLYPIFDWTDRDVWDYIKMMQIKVSDEYRETVRDLSPTRG